MPFDLTKAIRSTILSPAFLEEERWIVERYVGSDAVLSEAAKSLLSKADQMIEFIRATKPAPAGK
jgi:hypothetical protein